MICITPEKGKQAPQGRHTQGHFPQIAFCKRDIKCLLVGGGDKMQSWNWPVPTSGVIFQSIKSICI